MTQLNARKVARTETISSHMSPPPQVSTSTSAPTGDPQTCGLRRNLRHFSWKSSFRVAFWTWLTPVVLAMLLVFGALSTPPAHTGPAHTGTVHIGEGVTPAVPYATV
jgi:hypothetical protein